MKTKILITRPLPIDCQKALPEFELLTRTDETPPTQNELIALAQGCGGMISALNDPLSRIILQSCPKLKALGQYAVGVNNIDLDYCRERGLIVSHTPNVLTGASAGLAFSLMIALARRICEGHRFITQDQWRYWSPSLMLGLDLTGKTLGIIGMGRIGQRLAQMAQAAFGMKIIFYHPTKAGAVSLPELLKSSDVISLHTPLTPQTQKMISHSQLEQMKDEAILINTARGEIIDTQALLDVLAKGKLFGVGLDVTDPEPLRGDHPLLSYERVLITPHIASAERETRIKMAEMVCAQIKSSLLGGPIENRLV